MGEATAVDMEKKLAEMKQERAAAGRRMAMAELRHAEAVAALEKQLSNQQAEIDVLRGKAQELSRLQGWANEVLAPLGHKLQVAEQELAAQREQNRQLQNDKDQADSKAGELEAMAADLQQQTEELNAQLLEATDRSDQAADQQAADLRALRLELESKLQVEPDSARSSRAATLCAEPELTADAIELEHTRGRMVELEYRITELTATSDAAEQAAAAEGSRLRSELAAELAAKVAAEQKLAKLQLAISDQQQLQHEGSPRGQGKVRQRMILTEDKLAEAESRLAEVQEELQKTQATMAETASKQEDLDTQLAGAKAAAAETESRLAVSDGRRRAAESRVTEIENRLVELQTELGQANEAAAKSRASLERANDRKGKPEAMVSELEAMEREVLAEQDSRVRAECMADYLERKLSEVEEERLQLKIRVAAAEARRADSLTEFENEREEKERGRWLGQVFALFDLGGEGRIEAADLTQLFVCFDDLMDSGDWSEADNSKLLQRIDTEDGWISKEDFVFEFSEALPQNPYFFEKLIDEFLQVSHGIRARQTEKSMPAGVTEFEQQLEELQREVLEEQEGRVRSECMVQYLEERLTEIEEERLELQVELASTPRSPSNRSPRCYSNRSPRSKAKMSKHQQFIERSNYEPLDSTQEPTIVERSNYEPLDSTQEPTVVERSNYEPLDSTQEPTVVERSNYEPLDSTHEPTVVERSNYEPLDSTHEPTVVENKMIDLDVPSLTSTYSHKVHNFKSPAARRLLDAWDKEDGTSN